MSERNNLYREYLKSEDWQKLRQAKLTITGRICQSCARAHILHVHHVNYRNLHDCTLEDLLVFCHVCHDDLHMGAEFFGAQTGGMGLQWCLSTIASYRKTDHYKNRTERLKSNRTAKQNYFVSSNKANKRFYEVLKQSVNKCRKNHFSKESLENLIKTAQDILNQQTNPRPSMNA